MNPRSPGPQPGALTTRPRPPCPSHFSTIASPLPFFVLFVIRHLLHIIPASQRARHLTRPPGLLVILSAGLSAGKNLGWVGDPYAGPVKLTGRVSNPPLLTVTYAHPQTPGRWVAFNPLALSLSKGLSFCSPKGRSWFDRLTTNGLRFTPFRCLFPLVNSRNCICPDYMGVL